MGRRIVRAHPHSSLSPLPGRARLFFRRMYFSVFPVVLPIGLAERPPPTQSYDEALTLCTGRGSEHLRQTTTFFSSDDVMLRSCSVFFGKKFKGASSRSKYLKEPRHIPEAIRETFWFYAVPGTISLQFFFLPERGCQDLGCCHCGSRTNALAQLHFRASTEMSTFPHD